MFPFSFPSSLLSSPFSPSFSSSFLTSFSSSFLSSFSSSPFLSSLRFGSSLCQTKMKLTSLYLNDSPHAWASAGFVVHQLADEGSFIVRLDTVDVVLLDHKKLEKDERKEGIIGWGFDEDVDKEVCDIPTLARKRRNNNLVSHPNGVVGIDHIVLFAKSAEKVEQEVGEKLQVQRRRTIELGNGVTQSFYRIPTILEVVAPAPGVAENDKNFLWGVAFLTASEELTKNALEGERLGSFRNAKQGVDDVLPRRGTQHVECLVR
mmetsp:Transcript_36596/g.57429  ORF Transcript_36596/g.57429 Transcript_36596/m.57429 type:complete len:262 (+) Transcript_36596:50-835(+)